MPASDATAFRIARQRQSILWQLDNLLEMPLIILGFVWLALLIIDFVSGLNRQLQAISNVIWVVFIIDFALKITLAPAKIKYIRKNWLTLVALAIPALRIFRIFRAIRSLHALRAVRGIRLLRVMTSINRGMRALRKILRRRGFGYALALSLIVTFAGAAGMLAFEREEGLSSYGTALWWTAMIMTTMGSEYWPKTPEGRILCLVLSFYAFSVFGYVVATIASFFVDRDAESPESKLPNSDQLQIIATDIARLRTELATLSSRITPS